MIVRRTLLSALALALLVTPAFASGNDVNSRVRVIHASPDAPDVDVLVNGAAAIQNVAFGDISPYAELPANAYDVEVVPAGATSPAVIDLTGPNQANFFFGTDYTVLAVNTLDSIEPLVIEDTRRVPRGRASNVRFVHASPDAPAVDIKLVDGPFLFRNVSFREVGDYVTLPSGIVDVEVRVAGTETVALTLTGIALDKKTNYTVYAVGLLNGVPGLDAILSVDASR